jgi:translocation-and-assembly-module (TAM) inner membrane subunit TamB-like protein
VGEDGQTTSGMGWGWRRRAIVAALLFCAVLLIFHRPILLSLVRQIARHNAAGEHLKIDFRAEGSVFTNLTIRNLHVVPTGSTDVESIDVDFAHADYSLVGLVRHGMSQFFRNVEIRSARIVLNPTEVPLKPRAPKIQKRITLPSVFPDRVHLSDVTLIVRNKPHDFVLEHVDLDLNPRAPGQLRIGNLQLPTAQAWSKIAAQTSYANKNLLLRDLVLNDQERIRSLNVDASKIGSNVLSFKLDGTIGGGTISSSITLSETASSLKTTLHLLAENVAADVLNKYLTLPENFMSGEIQRVIVDGTGVLGTPRTWNGTLSARVNNFLGQEIAFDHGTLDVTARDGTATLRSADFVQGQNEFHFQGSAKLPENPKEFGRSPATLEIAAKTPDLRELTARTAEPLTGSAAVSGKIDIVNGKIDANLDVTADAIGFADGKIEKLTANVKASKTMPRPDVKKAWYADLRSAVSLDMSKIRYRDYIFDSAQGTLTNADDVLEVEKLTLERKQNLLSVHGRYWLPENFPRVLPQTAQLEFTLAATEMADYWTAESADKVSGPLQAAGQIEWKKGIGNGQWSISGANLRMRDLVFKQFNAQFSIFNNVVYVNDFSANLNEQDFVGATGIVDLRAPYHYSGKLSANVSDLSKLKPLLHAYGNENELAGSFVMNWEGSGDAAKFKNTGKLKLVFDKGRYGSAQSLQANADATYSPDGLDIPLIFVRSDKMDFQAIVQAKGETLEITKIQLDQGEAKYAGGYISIPFVWKNLGTDAPVLPPSGKVTATFQSDNIDIKKLFQDVGLEPAASGTVNVKLDAHGTLADLNARLDVQMRNLRSEKFEKLEPASFDLTVQSQHDRLSISGKLQQAKIQPLELTANLPFDVPKIVRQGKLPDDTPVTAKIRLPRSPVNFVRQIVPEIQELDGDVAVDVDVLGTVAKPFFTGTADMTINVARSGNTTFPALKDFKARLSFAQDTLSIEKFSGDLSGGRFTLTGHATFPKLTNANLDLHLKADSVLVTRNDAITARADADLKVVGPLTSANVTGNVAMTNSQFLKNIDLIPIGLPGRPAPQPPSSRTDFSISQRPFRDWKFDVTIKTKDPVLIRGNLATGGATSDLHLAGTGLRPGLQGWVRLDNVEATLPFSRMEISSGFLYFDPSDSLNPKIDLHGTSIIRDYTVRVYVYGTLNAPQAIFTSEPPLPQEEIISLLATGTTREELTGNNNVLAGRAAMLLVQQLYRKVFKKGQATQSNSVFNRLDLDVGTVDPRTGQQQATARFKINDQFVVLGDLGVGGDYRGMVKYLIRFR